MNRFISAMPSSMCWPLGENSQLKVDGMCSLLKVSAIASRANSPRRFTQGPRLVETVTSGEVVTMRCGEVAVAAADLVEQRAEAGLRRHRRLDGDRQSFRHVDRWRVETPRLAGGERHAVEEALQFVRRQRQAFELVPFVAGPHAHRLAENLHLRRRHQAGVIVLVAGDRQAEALDGVADEAGRPVMCRAL